jgi:hypothetical protein
MKIKMTLLVIITALVTLSFTYVATHEGKSNSTSSEKSSQTEVAGGLVSEEN